MKLPDIKTLNKTIKLGYNKTTDNIWLTEGKSLRRIVGVLAMSLPFLLILVMSFSSHSAQPVDSISHYYYTMANSIFIMVLSFLAIFLILYKGYNEMDFYVSFIAGFFALFVVLFPTSNLSKACCEMDSHAITYLQVNSFTGIREKLHFYSAGIFLLSLAYMSFFQFTKSDVSYRNMKVPKKIRNIIYRSCGIAMFLAILVIYLGSNEIILKGIYQKYHLTFWMETIAIESFGISWLVKADTIFKDRE